ncbi:MAG: hypothetical protein ICV87_13185 [Gemmatimonadetes bacterium]|nr:hypothetical protein [Gemmatimonadota bacterium]
MSENENRAAGERLAARGPLVTPYELVFGEGGFEERVFPGIHAEAESQAEDPARRDRFGFLSLAADAIRDVVPADATADILEEYRALFYHGFNFWRFGRRLYVLEPATARYLVEAAPKLAGWELKLPYPSVYVQLPPRLFWASIAVDAPPEPVDGFFAVQSQGIDPLGPGFSDLQVLMVLGVRRDRAGFSVIPFDTEVGPGIPADWAEAQGRADGPDFVNILPGGEMAGLYSILTNTEALKLLARALWYIDTQAGEIPAETAPERRADDREGSVPLSRLPFQRVRLADGE